MTEETTTPQDQPEDATDLAGAPVAGAPTRDAWTRSGTRAKTVVIAIVVLAVAAAGFGAWTLFGEGDGLPDGAVLEVGDHTVTRAEYERRIAVLEALYGVKQPTEGAEREDFRRDAAKSMAVSLIMNDRAADEDVVVPEKKAQDALAKIIDEQIPDGQTGFTRFLERTQVTEADVLEEVRLQLLTSLLFDKITSDVDPVTDDDVQTAYDRGKADLVTPERRRVSNIVVATREEATSALRRLRSGQSFAAVARSVSLDGTSRDKGGDLGLVSADELLPAYSRAVFEAEVGALFGPVQTDYGWNVGRVVAVAEPQQLTFAEVEDRLRARLEDEGRYEVWRAWLADQIKGADVTYADDFRPDDPDAPPSDSASPAASSE